MAAKMKSSVAALLATLSLTAQAANFNYNYGQVGLETGDYEGLVLTGSFEINQDMFIRASYADVTNDEAGFDIDYTEYAVGAGYHMPLNTQTDAVFTLSLHGAEIDVPGFILRNNDDTGLLATGGVRHNLTQNVEVAGHVFHTTVFDGDTGIYGEARFKFNSAMSVGVNFTSSDAIDGLGVNFRMGF